MQEPEFEAAVADDAWAFLRANSTGSLRFGQHLRDVRYVMAADGRLILSVMVAMLEPAGLSLFVPGYEEGAMELSVTLEEFEERGAGGAMADRWRVYHGEAPDVQWAIAEIDAARFHDRFVDGEAMVRSNPLVDSEASVCREVNASRTDDLRAACAAVGVDVPNPVLVGIDPLGWDIRATFGIIRIPPL
ncbi:MAG: hypothetical protein QGH76_05635 [Phycisphaerales bacterium]|nr:hypothetical protein [Phycisphaerales bacterium]